MAPPVKRRLTPVCYAKQLINAIIFTRQQKQIPNFERISRCLQRLSEISTNMIKQYLDSAVSDGFILEYTAVGFKGQRTGLEQEGYRIPNVEEAEIEDDGHDWYCFECHEPGEVYECSECFRVYHSLCTKEDTTKSIFTCSTCKACKRKSGMKKKFLNSLLNYTILNLREKDGAHGTPVEITENFTRDLYKVGHKINDDFRRFVYREMDLCQMEQKVQASSYRCIEEFHADAQSIVHNCVLAFGEEKGTLSDLAIAMMKACKYDLNEIEVCPSCYYVSNAKPEDWFSQPCNPPHELVYAKQKGYSYWPAKVVKDMGGKYDVRFFGGWHERAIIPAEYVKPINTDPRKLVVKITAGFQKSILELKKYQSLLKESECGATNNDESEEQTDNERDELKYNQEVSSEEKQLEHEKKIRGKSKVKDRRNFQVQGKKATKRKIESTNESVFRPEDEATNRQVTSTSVENNAKERTRKLSKNSAYDETHTVTSSGDKITNSYRVPTVSTAVQTFAWRSTASTQTDVKTFKTQSTATDAVTLPDVSTPTVTELSQKELNDKMWEERMALAMASLANRLKKKFEEDKNVLLKELSQQLEEDFGKDKQQAVERTLAGMKLEVEKARKFGEERAREKYMEEMKKLAAKHKDTISQAKKMQWCQFCEEEAMYHCCWNTSYCSVKCQQDHWHKEHKRVCRRKRTQEAELITERHSSKGQ